MVSLVRLFFEILFVFIYLFINLFRALHNFKNIYIKNDDIILSRR